MSRIKTKGITIEYESFGSVRNEAIVLISGLGAQLTQWPVELCKKLAKKGYRVIRFDNRDSGLSSKVVPPNALNHAAMSAALIEGDYSFTAYSIDDMAKDVVDLLDALKIPNAHIAGAGLGSTIAQTFAADHPERVLSLTSIMGTTGNPDLPPADAEVQKLLLGPTPLASDIERIVSRDITLRRMIGGPDYPTDNATLREWSLRDSLRAYYPAGTLRQMAAALAGGDRREVLARIKVPTVVVHGKADIFVPVAAGKDTAQAIPGAELRIIEGMGHELAIGLVGTISEAVIAAAERATGPRSESAVNDYAASKSGEGGFLSGLFQWFRRARVPAGA